MFQSSQFRSVTDQFNEWAQQPVFFAAIASLGLHGILFAALPSLSPAATSDDSQRTVPVVELGTEDISRLPSFVDLNTPNIPQTVPYDPYDLNLNPLEPSDDVDSLEQLLDSLDTNPSRSSLDNDFETRPLTPLESPWSGSFRIPPPPPNFPPINPPSRTPDITIAPDNQATGDTDQDSRAPSQDSGTESQDNSNTDQGNDDTSQNDSGDPSTDPDADQTAARPLEPDPTPSTAPEDTQANLAALLQYAGPTDRETLEKEFNTARQTWKTLIEERPDITATDDADTYISIIGEYPKFACLLQTDDIDVTIAVFVDAANQVLENPEPVYILRSWRQWFDDKALELIQDYDFDNQTGMIRSYLMTVTFDYESEKCPLPPAGSSSATGSNGAEQGNSTSTSPDSPDSSSQPPDTSETTDSPGTTDSSETTSSGTTNSTGTANSSETTDPSGVTDQVLPNIQSPDSPASSESGATPPETPENGNTADDSETSPADES